MKYIAKMKADFARQIELAELENNINSRFQQYKHPESLEVSISEPGGNDIKKYGIKYCIFGGIVGSRCARYDRDELFHSRAELLRAYPVTQKINEAEYRGPHDYIIGSSRGFSDICGSLSISWISGEFKISIELPIEDSGLEQFFRIGSRYATDIELSVYTSVHDAGTSPFTIREYAFKADSVKFYGGRRTLVDDTEIRRIIDSIIN